MRLKTEEIHAIKSAVREVFGERIAVDLFGSRVEDEKKGGDIDLYLELPTAHYRSMQRHLFRARLSESLGDQKIDIIIDQMIFRWIKIQDSMRRRLIPLLVESIVPSTDESMFIDKLNTLEKRGLIERSQWHILRSRRDQLTHIYPKDRLETIETIRDALDAIWTLEDIYKNVIMYRWQKSRE